MFQDQSSSKPKLAVIIPLRQNGNVDVAERLKWKSIPRTPEIEVIIVDDGSLNADAVKATCLESGWRYEYLHTADAPFSLARARNVGIRVASAEFVYFEDVDFLHQSDFYQRLIRVCSHLDVAPFNFAAIPTLFLTQEASSLLIEKIGDRDDFDAQIESYVARLPFINPDEPNDVCASFAPVGSNIVLRRSACFHVGLFDEYFNSWGGEDRDFVYRLLHHNGFLTRPDEFSVTKPWRIHRTNAYEGWRAAYRLHGDWARGLGLYAVHIYHPDNGWKDPYAREANFKYAETKAIDLSGSRLKLTPTPIDREKVNVFIGRNPVFYNDAVMELLGSVSVIEPDRKIDPADFAREIMAQQPGRVFFQNPYGNEWLLSIWRLLQDEGVKCVCAERGALPWSIYFDDGGFCCDSPAYGKEHWENADPIDAADYLAKLRASGQFLEPQGKKSVEDLKPSLDPQKRTVLVLLQSLTDATTLHFSGPMGNYAGFLSIMRELVETGRYNVLVKNHPLNKNHPLPNHGTPVEDYPIYDLYEIADTVVTLNSGAGMLAMGAGRPVVTMGTSFYAHDGLAASATDLSSLIEQIDRGDFTDRDSVNRFFGFLVNDFYSFADWTYGSRDYSDNTKMSTMANVRYRKIAIGELRKSITKSPLDKRSLIMDPYAYHQFAARKPRVSTTSPSVATPDHDELVAQARKALDENRYADAANYFTQASNHGTDPVALLCKAAEACIMNNDRNGAINRLLKALAASPATKRCRDEYAS